jgi:arginyl-tRNA synthetase
MQEISEQLKTTIRNLYGLDVEPNITPSPGNIDADYSSNVALRLAKDLHRAPMEIANEIASKISAKVSTPGFLNFTLSDEYLSAQIDNLSTNFRENISSDEYSGKTVICEFSDPNPFKVLHVGHLYTSIVGDSISRLFEYAGAKVIRANFGGDVGLHVAKTLYILEQKSPADFTIEDIAKCYVEGTAAYDDSEDAHAKITELNKKIYQICCLLYLVYMYER